jgi:hypothetical protein
VANALVTERLIAAHSSSPSTTPTSWARPAAGPPRRSAESTVPKVASKVASAGTPAIDAMNRPPIRVRRLSGSNANRAGSSDSSTPKKTSGRKNQPSTMPAPPRVIMIWASRSSSSRPGTAKIA